jgi:hypothetical protein
MARISMDAALVTQPHANPWWADSCSRQSNEREDEAGLTKEACVGNGRENGRDTFIHDVLLKRDIHQFDFIMLIANVVSDMVSARKIGGTSLKTLANGVVLSSHCAACTIHWGVMVTSVRQMRHDGGNNHPPQLAWTPNPKLQNDEGKDLLFPDC